MGPRYISWYMAVLIVLLPGIGLLKRLYKQYFCAQYIISIPKNANTTITGCNETKKHTNKNKLTIYIY
jgi:hypothetical protein